MPTKQRGRSSNYVQAREAASGRVDDEVFVLKPGEILSKDHPIVRAYPDFFEPMRPSRDRPAVEEMTAEPGRKRGEL